MIRYRKEGEYFDVQMAIDGVLAVPQEIHASVREESFPTEESWMAYLVRSAQSLIQVFGDARDNKIVMDMDPDLEAA